MAATQSPISDIELAQLRFRRQWVIDSNADATPRPSWRKVALGGLMTVNAHPDALLAVNQEDGPTVVVIGAAVDTQTDLATGVALAQRLASLSEQELLEALRWIVGSYVVLRALPSGWTLYSDPGGMMGVYKRGHRYASSPSLLGSSERDAAIDLEYRLNGVDDWYPGTICPVAGVSVLPANHATNISTGTTRRFWPLDIPSSMPWETGIRELATHLRKAVRGASELGTLLFSLTGGRDSRVTLAASRGLEPRPSFFTIMSGSASSDMACVRQLVPLAGIKHQFVEDTGSAPELLSLYDEVSAHMSVGARRGILNACHAMGGPNVIHVSGALGEIARGYYWPIQAPRSFTDTDLYRPLKSRAPAIRSALRGWRASVPDLPPHALLNLLYLEQRGGRWAGVGENASSLFFLPFTPFSSRRAFELVCSLPIERQRGNMIPEAVVESLSPELSGVPYATSSGGFGRYLPANIRALLKKIKRIVR